ncbi:MAG: PEP-CTERM sorting domain-containing protein [Akkermansiaceae bacterium]|nr:PEP-CTERM sorting domain-containing protein [Akkermansiaceae bacterium]MCP5544560.1 PEP-CTERM sorting domain-containing protein [Akkermansiaceae bacterium]MCP5547972.1 PEP-CTERM sorting domain-containing protein [Akkermansiaceae bacterium]
MDTPCRKPLALAATLITLGSLAGGAGAAVTITQFDVTTNSITVSITGDLSGITPGSTDPDRLYIGVPGDNDWILFQGTATVGSIQASNAGASTSHLAGSYGSGGDFIRIGWATPLTQSDSFSGQFTITASNGAFVPANLNPADLVVTWSFNSATIMPDVSTLAGGSAVPEPSSALFVGLAALGLTARRRRH